MDTYATVKTNLKFDEVIVKVKAEIRIRLHAFAEEIRDDIKRSMLLPKHGRKAKIAGIKNEKT